MSDTPVLPTKKATPVVERYSEADLPTAAGALVHPGHRYEPSPRLRQFHDDEHQEFLATRELAATRWGGWRADG